MGPEGRGGWGGGLVIAEGTPEQIAADPDSYTGQYLARILDGRAALSPRARAGAMRSEPTAMINGSTGSVGSPRSSAAGGGRTGTPGADRTSVNGRTPTRNRSRRRQWHRQDRQSERWGTRCGQGTRACRRRTGARGQGSRHSRAAEGGQADLSRAGPGAIGTRPIESPVSDPCPPGSGRESGDSTRQPQRWRSAVTSSPWNFAR